MFKKNNCLIVLDLNFFNLPIILLGLCLYSRVMFVFCGSKFASWCGPILLVLGVTQLTEHEYHKGGTFNTGNKHAIGVGKKIASKCARLLKSLQDHGFHIGFSELVSFCFVGAWHRLAFIQPFLEKFLIENSENFSQISIWGQDLNQKELWPNDVPRHVNFLSGPLILKDLFRYLKKISFVVVLAGIPLLNLGSALFRGVKISFKPKSPEINGKRILYFHRHKDLMENPNPFRDMTFFREGSLTYSSCIHTVINEREKFSQEKRNFLTQNGGAVLTLEETSIHLVKLFEICFKGHLAVVSSALPIIIFQKFISLKFLKLYFRYSNLKLLSYILLKNSGVDIVVLEVEHDAIARAMGMVARAEGVRVVTMVHGSGGQRLFTWPRCFSWADYYIVEGHEFEPLRENSPAIRHIYPAGSIEISSCVPNFNLLPPFVRKKRGSYKVIALLLNLGTLFLDEYSILTGSSYIEEKKIKYLINLHMKPFFEWVAKDSKLIILWCARPRQMHKNRHLRSFFDLFSEERIVFIEGQNMGNVIATSDVCVASAGSTAATVSLIHGKPTVIHDMFYGGKEPRWAKSLICEDGDSLVFRLKNLLKFGIDEKILKTAKWAMHADFDVNSSANTRISNLFENLLATAGEYPDPRNFTRSKKF